MGQAVSMERPVGPSDCNMAHSPAGSMTFLGTHFCLLCRVPFGVSLCPPQPLSGPYPIF